RLNPKNTVPAFINDFGNINLLEAVFAHNPGLYLAKGASMKVLGKVLGKERDPLAHLSKSFQSISGYMGNAKPPTPAPTLALPPGRPGAPSFVNNQRAIPLPAGGNTTLRTTFGGPLTPKKVK